MAKYVEAIKENAANAVKEPCCREFNVLVMPNRPNHVFLFEVYDNEAALAAHRNTDHFKKYAATTANMVADRNARAMSTVCPSTPGAPLLRITLSSACARLATDATSSSSAAGAHRPSATHQAGRDDPCAEVQNP
jgi:(4S)-4-hydroxy-5-phosphonooxypentane-2,3-dione isomerase